MSIVVGISDGRHVYLEGDNLAISYDRRMPMSCKKVCDLGDGLIIGSSGYAAAMSLIVANGPRLLSGIKNSKERFLEELRNLMSYGGVYRQKDEDPFPNINGDLLVGWYGTLYYLAGSLLNLVPINDGELYAIGSGADYAFGAFRAAKLLGKGLDELEMMRIAIDAACHYDPYCGIR